LKNFKAWEDTGDVELAPLTLLFGANSSGKSSLHQFLLMLQQTIESPDRRRVLHTGDDRTPVDLGSYSSLLRNANVELPLEFELDWRRSTPLQTVYGREQSRLSIRDMRFKAAIGATADAPPRLRVDNYSYEFSADKTDILRLGSERGDDGGYVVRADGIELVRTLGRKWPVSPPSQFHAFPDDLPTRYQYLDFAADLTLALEEQLRAINYLGPLREKPSRLYRWSGEEVSHVGWRGEHSIEALLAGRARKFNFAAKRKLQPLQVLVAQWLRDLGVIDKFSVTQIGEGRDEYEVRVTTPGSQREVLLTDIGFGVSQVLPVVVEAFYSAPGATVVMEQPEIHLHPAVQAGLADLFIAAISAREESSPRNTQFIVESHSEHLLRRLLRRIAENEVDPANVRCYVVNSGRRGSRIHALDFDEYGNVRNWPENFFGDPAADIIAQSRSARARRNSAPR
jgi:predicted ATPase